MYKVCPAIPTLQTLSLQVAFALAPGDTSFPPGLEPPGRGMAFWVGLLPSQAQGWGGGIEKGVGEPAVTMSTVRNILAFVG